MNVLDEVRAFYRNFKGCKGVMGYSERLKPIYYFKIVKSDFPVIIATYSIHAREHITARLALKQIGDFERFGVKGTVYFAPMLNPDGVNIAISKNPLYKANARGVDLNVNFDACWGLGAQNVRVKGDQNYIGRAPFSEKESRALRDFTLYVNPQMTISYHCKGEEIYCEFFQDKNSLKRDFGLAKAVSDVTGYTIKSTPNSVGGYKDWCIQKLKIPALTIEVGNDAFSHPLGSECLPEIYSKNKNVIKALTENSLWN